MIDPAKFDELLGIAKNTAVDVKQIREDNEEFRNRIEKLEKGESLLRLENSKLREEIEQLKNEMKVKNIVITGVPESNGSEENLEGIVREIVEKQVGVELRTEDVDGVNRLGRIKSNGRMRPVLLKVSNKRKKTEIMRNRKNLRGTKIFLQDDLSEYTREREKALVPFMKEKRNEGRKATIRWGKLYVDGARHYPSESTNTEERNGGKRTMSDRSPNESRQESTGTRKSAKTDEQTSLLRIQSTLDKYKKTDTSKTPTGSRTNMKDQ